MNKDNILEDYEEYLNIKGYKEQGIRKHIRTARDFLTFVTERAIDVKLVSIREAEEYREELSLMLDKEGNTRYKPSTINGIITHLKSFYHFLLTHSHALKNPFSDVDRMKEGFSLPKNILIIDEMKKLLEGITLETKADFKFKVLIELLYSTGARISEIAGLTLSDINLKEGYILIRDNKERKDRKAPLTEMALHLLNLYMKYIYPPLVEGLLFPHGKQGSLNKWINDKLKRLTKELDLPKITCHSIRHTIATHLFKKGAGIREVQEFLGHRRIDNTEIYTRVLTEDLKKIVEECHPRELEGVMS